LDIYPIVNAICRSESDLVCFENTIPASQNDDEMHNSSDNLEKDPDPSIESKREPTTEPEKKKLPNK
jgi:hypothetical protein